MTGTEVDLHSRLRSTITERLETARRVGRERWTPAFYSTMDEWRVRDVATGEPRADITDDDRSEWYTRHIAANNPASMISLYEGLLRIVDSHAPREVRNRIDSWGNPMVACDSCWRKHPCPTVSILADSLGVDTGGTDG